LLVSIGVSEAVADRDRAYDATVVNDHSLDDYLARLRGRKGESAGIDYAYEMIVRDEARRSRVNEWRREKDRAEDQEKEKGARSREASEV
jgi:hypothetical protein